MLSTTNTSASGSLLPFGCVYLYLKYCHKKKYEYINTYNAYNIKVSDRKGKDINKFNSTKCNALCVLLFLLSVFHIAKRPKSMYIIFFDFEFEPFHHIWFFIASATYRELPLLLLLLPLVRTTLTYAHGRSILMCEILPHSTRIEWITT